VRATVLLVMLALALPARAADPSLATYSADGSRLLWVLQITDSHIDTFLGAGEEERLAWALSEAFFTIQPDAFVNTGDVTDGTNGILYSGANEGEWQLYRSLVDQAGLNDLALYVDLVGNHDAYGDDGLALYRHYSVVGSATGRTQAEWRVDRPWGSTCFVGVATPQEEGKAWPADPAELTAAELAETEAFLTGNPECRLTLAFGHHDALRADAVEGAEAFSALCQAHGIGHYAHGHEHDLMVSVGGDQVTRFRLDSLGQGGGDNVAVHAVDHDVVSFGTTSATDPWPLIVVTAPARGRFQTGSSWGNPEYVELPYAPAVPASCAAAPVRALVFDAGEVSKAVFRWDEGAWSDLARRQDVPVQWRGSFDATALGVGWHTLTVRATGTKERSASVDVRVVDGSCELGDEDLDGPPLAEPEPEAAAESSPEALPEAVPEVAPEAVPEAVPEGVAELAAPERIGEVRDELAVPEPDAEVVPGADTGALEAAADTTPSAKDASALPDTLGGADGAAETADVALGTKPRPEGTGSRSSCAVDARGDAGGAGALLLAGLAVVVGTRRKRETRRGQGTVISYTPRS